MNFIIAYAIFDYEKAIQIFELTLLVFYTVGNCIKTDPLLID